MKLDKHFAYRVLTDVAFAHEVCESMYPALTKELVDSMVGKQNEGATKNDIVAAFLPHFQQHPHYQGYLSLFDMVRPEGIKPYVITDSVMDKLDLLKVNKSSDYFMRVKEDKESYVPIKTYEWSVFSKLPRLKALLVLPNNSLLIVHQSTHFLGLFFLDCKVIDWDKNEGQVNWTCSFIDRDDKRLSPNWMSTEMQRDEEYIFKLLCFIYLSENEEVIVQPGHRYGTKKQGKVVNGLPLPVTVVTSKWNVTSIRTEGFDVSGHFRLQPTVNGTKMIWINPFRKHGYVRHAKKEDNI